jgi:hypothetical protein
MQMIGMNPRNKGNSYETIVGKLSAIRWCHKLFMGQDLVPGVRLELLLAGIRKTSLAQSGKLPVSLNLLLAIYGRLNPCHSTSPQFDRVLWGVITLGFFFMARRSEIALGEDQSWGHAVLSRDIRVEDAQGRRTSDIRTAVRVTMTFRSSKTDQRSAGAVRSLTKSGHGILCPVRGALWALSASSEERGSFPLALLTLCTSRLGTWGSGKGVRFSDIASIIKRAAADIGLDGDLFSTHSLRAGGATYLANQGVDILTIKFLGRWKSNAVERYIHVSQEMLDPLSQRVLQGPLQLNLL